MREKVSPFPKYLAGAFLLISCGAQPSTAPPSEPQREHPSPGTSPPQPPSEPLRIASGPSDPDCGLSKGLRNPDWPIELRPTSELEAPRFAEGSVTLAVLPDTQYYVRCEWPHLEAQAEFLRKKRDQRTLLAAVTVGNLTDDNWPKEWAFFRRSISTLPANFPLILSSGNHDHGDHGTANHRRSGLDDYFSEDYAKGRGLVEVFRQGSIENAFYVVERGPFRLGILSLEWSPRKQVVDWANRILERHAAVRTLVLTHAYLYHDSTRYDFARYGEEQEWSPLAYGTAQGMSADMPHDGEMLWKSLISVHKNVFLVLSGHVLKNGTGFLESRGAAGNTVHQILANYQMLAEGGLGYMRLLEFRKDGSTVQVKTYSPSLGLFAEADDQRFSFQVEPKLF